MDCLGANVTAPHKQAIIPWSMFGDEVRALGALNTIVNVNGRLVAGNTDARGLARWMRLSHIDPAGRRRWSSARVGRRARLSGRWQTWVRPRWWS